MAAAAAAPVILGIWASGVLAIRHETGYFSPLFAPDGGSVFAITREVAATIVGFGYEFFTAPATVWLQSDRFKLVNIRLADGRLTVIEAFPPSPLEGSRIHAYHGAIFGVPHAHLRWADAGHLDYEVAVTRHDTPLARTFVIRRVWNAAARQYTVTSPWQETPTGMAGDQPQQLHGDLEAIAVDGDELMPCAIAVLRRDSPTASALVQTTTCRRKYPSGLTATLLAPMSRRREIERAQMLRTTYAELVEQARRSGLPEGEAMLEAGRRMQRLGLYPKSTMLVAHAEPCAAQSPLFRISDEQFRVGLFPDIDRAIARPDQEVEKSMGAYIVHRDYTTSQEINAFLDAGHGQFVVEARGGCWRLTISRP
jgi:hypothetical protein